VCLFVHKHLGIVIESHRKDLTAVKFIEDDDEIDGIFKDKSIVKLFFKGSNTYHGNTANWGNQGIRSLQDVCGVEPNNLKILKKTH
jgi:hypothetical protein